MVKQVNAEREDVGERAYVFDNDSLRNNSAFPASRLNIFVEALVDLVALQNVDLW